jgi:hypothetical protein
MDAGLPTLAESAVAILDDANQKGRHSESFQILELRSPFNGAGDQLGAWIETERAAAG